MKAKTIVSTDSKSFGDTSVLIGKEIRTNRKTRRDATFSRINHDQNDDHLKRILTMVKAIRNGDFSIHLNLEDETLVGDIAKVLNEINEMNLAMANEFARVANAVGKENNMAERINVNLAKGPWVKSSESVNALIDNLVQPIDQLNSYASEIARVAQEVSIHGRLGGRR